MNQTLWDLIEKRRAQRNVLEHPFYQRWAEGRLERSELALYAGQYRHAVEALAAITASAAELAPDGHGNGLAAHAAEEATHVPLWDTFCEAVGGSTSDPPTAETRECVEAWTAGDGLLPTLIRMYAVESGQSEIARTKLDGLRDHYGITGAGTEYFAVHQELDVEHSRHARDLIERLLDDDADLEELADVAARTFEGNWRLLDGVEERSRSAA